MMEIDGDERQDDSQLKKSLETVKISPDESDEIVAYSDKMPCDFSNITKGGLPATSAIHTTISDEGGHANKQSDCVNFSLEIDKSIKDDLNINCCAISNTPIKETKKSENIDDMNGKKQGHTNDFSEEYKRFYGHKFDEDFVLRDEKGKKFDFSQDSVRCLNQERYERIGEAVINYVYELLLTRCHMRQHFIPFDAADTEPKGFFFASQNALRTPDKLLILISGCGVSRAGQWARRIIINDNLMEGSQIPYIERAHQEGYEVVVLNTNQNYVGGKPIRGSDTPEAHALYVWENFVMKTRANHVAIAGFSYGGQVTLSLAKVRSEQFMEKVFAVALADSVHSFVGLEKHHDLKVFLKKHTRNWVASDKKLDEKISNGIFNFLSPPDLPKVSAGHTKHEWTPATCMTSVFKFFNEQLTICAAGTGVDEVCHLADRKAVPTGSDLKEELAYYN